MSMCFFNYCFAAVVSHLLLEDIYTLTRHVMVVLCVDGLRLLQ